MIKFIFNGGMDQNKTKQNKIKQNEIKQNKWNKRKEERMKTSKKEEIEEIKRDMIIIP